MKDLRTQIEQMPFVTCIRETSGKTLDSKKHLIIVVSKRLLHTVESIGVLFDMLNNQSIYQWTLHMKE